MKENRNDKEMESLNEELITLEAFKNQLIQKLQSPYYLKIQDERSAMLEIRAGAGGNEVCIWAVI